MNCSPGRAAVGAHYVDLSSHLKRHPFQGEQFRYAKKFEEKSRVALINTGAAPGLTIFAREACRRRPSMKSKAVHISGCMKAAERRSYLPAGPPEVSFDEAVSHHANLSKWKVSSWATLLGIGEAFDCDPIGNARAVLAAPR